MTKIYFYTSLGVLLLIAILRLGKYLFAVRERKLQTEMPHWDELEVREDCYEWYDGFVLRAVGVIGALVITCL